MSDEADTKETNEAPKTPLVIDPKQDKSAQQHQAQIEKQLWAIANQLRGNSSMEASEFKNYILSILFYKFLSEKIEDLATEALDADGLTYEQAWANEATRQMIIEELVSDSGYMIEPKNLFSSMIREINKGEAGEFDTELLDNALKALIRSTKGSDSEDDFDNLFDDIDLNSSKLGKDVATRSKFMAGILTSLDAISFHHNDVEIDVLGNAYEYLISNFAASAGKKAGEFYTPQQVSKILAKIVTAGKDRIKDVYDPTCGSGSLLLRVTKELKKEPLYYGQELGTTTYNLARMNMMLHGVPYSRFDIQNGNTLTDDRFVGKTFEAIVANPPYSANWEPDAKAAADDRFSGYGKLAPSSKADYAFVQHMLHHLDYNGIAAAVLPHGVLFRGAAEGEIRKKLLDNNWIDAIIGLPANIFYGTSIPTCILVFKKNRKADDKVLFIDASSNFEKGKNQNNLTEKNVSKIIESYINRKESDNFSTSVSLGEISSNQSNLNISRYIGAAETTENIDLKEVEKNLFNLNAEIGIINREIEVELAALSQTFNESGWKHLGVTQFRDWLNADSGLIRRNVSEIPENSLIVLVSSDKIFIEAFKEKADRVNFKSLNYWLLGEIDKTWTQENFFGKTQNSLNKLGFRLTEEVKSQTDEALLHTLITHEIEVWSRQDQKEEF